MIVYTAYLSTGASLYEMTVKMTGEFRSVSARNDCENEWRIQGLCPRTFRKSRMVGIPAVSV